jgi:hypothetical protein
VAIGARQRGDVAVLHGSRDVHSPCSRQAGRGDANEINESIDAF